MGKDIPQQKPEREVSEKCRISNVLCEHCSTRTQCPKDQVTERLRNEIISLNNRLAKLEGKKKEPELPAEVPPNEGTVAEQPPEPVPDSTPKVETETPPPAPQ
jgi:hypothetical protein